MNAFLLWVCALGPALLAEALLARYEVLAYSAGWRAPTTELPEGVPYARGADPDSPRMPTSSTWTGSGNAASATPGTAASWSRR